MRTVPWGVRIVRVMILIESHNTPPTPLIYLLRTTRVV